MHRILTVALGMLVVVGLALPLLNEVPGGSEANSAGASIPSLSEAPPEWDQESLAGTAWTVDMRKAKGEWKAKLIFTYYFQTPQRVVLRTTDPEMLAKSEPELTEDEQVIVDSLFEGFLSDEAGLYTVDNGTIDLKITMLGTQRTDSIEIRGNKLYYHGVPMKQSTPFKPEV